MSYSEKIKLAASDKFYMARIQGGKIFTDENCSFVNTFVHGISGGTLHVFEGTIQRNLKVSSFYVNDNPNLPDAVITQISTNSFPNTNGVAPYYNTFYYDPETGYIKFAVFQVSTPSIQDNITLILEYFIFFTNFTGKRAPYDMASGAEVYWEPRLPKDIDLGFSQANNITGQLSISTSSIELKNQDLYLNDFFSTHDSFNNREVKVWRCIDGISHYQFEFSGVIKGAKINDQVASFDLTDIMSLLDKTFYGYDSNFKRYSDLHDGSTYIIRADDQAKPIYRIFGKIGPYDVFYFNTSQDNQVRLLDVNKTLPAVCVNYNAASKTTSTNRKWSVGFGPSVVALKSMTVTAVANLVLGTYSASQLTVTGDAQEVFAVGDTFRLGGQYGVIVGVAGSVIEIWPYNASLATGTIERIKVPAVVIEQNGDKYYPLSFRDYNVTIGAEGDIQLDFVNNFEANHSGFGTLDPDISNVYARMWNDEYDSKASSIVKAVLDEAGLVTSSSFIPNQSPPWSDPNLAFSIPFPGESDFPTCREVVEKGLKSALSFIYFDSNGEVRYKSFLDGIQADPDDIENESGQDPNDVINQSNSSNFSVSFDLYDQFIGTYLTLPNAPQSSSFYENYADSYRISGVSARELRLYKTNLFYETDSVIDIHGQDIEDFLEEYNSLITGRRAVFSLTVFSRHFRLFIGDDMLVSRTKIAGGVNEGYMRVVAISKGYNESDLKLLDLKRFPQ
jgi:hypothetical protein